MADEKKYTAREAALAVLAKTQDLLQKSELVKSANPDEKADAKLGEAIEGLCERHMMDNKDAERKEGHKIVKSEMCKMCKSGMQKAEFADLHEMLEKMTKKEGVDENEIGTKFEKYEDENEEKPSDSMHPRIKEEGTERDYKDFEAKPGHSSSSKDDHRQEEQKAPEKNPKEQAEGNNPPSGSVPGNGIHKLMYFMGHMRSKKKMKKGIALS